MDHNQLLLEQIFSTSRSVCYSLKLGLNRSWKKTAPATELIVSHPESSQMLDLLYQDWEDHDSRPHPLSAAWT